MKRFLFCTVAVLAVLSFGIVLIHCGNGNGDHQCDTNEDCPQDYWCDRTVWECKKIDCIPNCTGKCCGDDGCNEGNTCPNNCPNGYECNMTSCMCEATGCQTEADCTLTQCCKVGVCTDENCTGLQCGPDPVCGNECGSCAAGTHCDQGTCIQDVVCVTDNDCLTNECCIGTPLTCQPRDCTGLECGADPVCGIECGPCVAPEVCNAGVCEDPGPGDLCPSGQECVQVGANGSMGCVIPPNTIPGTNPTDCANIPCEGNFSCYCMDATCTTSQCVENCGTCAAGSECCQYTASGIVACMLPGCTDDLPNPPFCDANTPCQGNSGCFTDGTNNWCANLCSVDHGPCTNNDTKCDGDTVQTCTNSVWVDTTDCTATSQVCLQGACVTPGSLGDFCEDTGCEVGLDCVGAEGAAHSFCTPQCDCDNGTGCDAGWECMFSSSGTPPTCWCGKLCPNNNPATDCPNGGTDWECLETEVGSGIYYCNVP